MVSAKRGHKRICLVARAEISNGLTVVTWYEFLARGRLSSLVCASVRNIHNNSSTAAGLALEPDLSSTLEMYVGTCAGGLGWCIAVRIIARAMCCDDEILSRKLNRVDAAVLTGDAG